MPRFAANISMLFTELPFLDRIDAAAAAGFDALECQFPYPHSITELRRRIRDRDLPLVLINAPAGDWPGGERGLAVLDEPDRFETALDRARTWAVDLGCPSVHVLSGVWTGNDRPWPRVHDRLGRAADVLGAEGITMLVEALNPRDVPGYAIDSIPRAISTLEAIGRPNAALLFDIYHARHTEPDALARLREVVGRIGHVQFAGVPDRAEPGEEYERYWTALAELGYDGWVGAEYRPRGATRDGLTWLRRSE